LLDLSIGLCFLHRAMQRQADNRHIMILQGMTFIFQYYRGIYSKSKDYEQIQAAAMKQQAEYNVARAFHQLSLFTFASKYYQTVIEISDKFGGLGKRDLIMEAAYNLSLIFMLSGNEEASKEITEKYLVI
jgi:general transcription factor 3C polypeptide 3 (transcription factor C subunit 4)